ncbi:MULTISPECIES: glycosyltransferase family 9 protein [unclassified Clostridium]|uniref:glycosyltransferase family 9 protein n=1 Tax=unclassified Clostridium TaxID=2614128 RepID=UPI0002983388|nr:MULTISPECIES: glycosyltransferase family 9 protein [unclassified Clostridium]EKQ56967.1 MAG: ADP-heptose:LPS heptosyltransferase [Clostridium sp. Maddingley MBC34-26]
MNFLIFGGVGIGDTVIELSLAKALKKIYPDSKINLILSDALGSSKIISEIIECQKYVQTCWFYSRKKPLQSLKVLLELRKEKYNYGFSCTTSFKAGKLPGIICKAIGCKSVIKQIGGKTGFIDYPIQVDENMHIVQQYERLLERFNSKIKLDLNVFCKERFADILKIEKNEQKLVTICLGTNITIYNKGGAQIKKNIKEWGILNWVSLSEKLCLSNLKVAFIGGIKESQQLEEISKKISISGVINYAGKTSIKESLAILNQSDIVVGADTGMMHCAAALEKRTITLFGGTDPNIWKPYSAYSEVIWGKTECAPCYGKAYAIECDNRKCMETIAVNRVYEKIIDNLGENL